MKKFWNELSEFIKKPSFTVPLILTLIMGYGFAVTHFTVGIDTLARSRYINGQLFAQGRFSSSFISYFLRFTDAYPFAEDLLAVIVLFCAAAVLCVVLKNASANRLLYPVYPVFACLFVSYPLINEIFIYNGASLNVAIGYLLTGIALLITDRTLAAVRQKERKKQVAGTVFTALILAFLMSLYESFVFVYVLCVCIILTLNGLYGETGAAAPEKKEKWDLPKKIAVYAFPLVCGVAAEFVFGKIADAVFHFSGQAYAANVIQIPDHFSFGMIVSTVYTLFRRCFLNAFWYLPILIFAVCMIVSCLQCVIFCIKKKSAWYILFYAGMYFSLFAIGLVKFGDLKYRTAQTFAIFTSFTIVLILQYLLTKSKKTWLRAAALSLCGLLVFYQAIDLSKHFSDNHRRWTEEKEVLISVGNKLQSEYAEAIQSKPVIFIGEYRLSDSILSNKYVRADDPGYLRLKRIWALFGGDLRTGDYDETYVLIRAQHENGSVIAWGIDSFDDGNTELYNILEYLGYSFQKASYEQYLNVSDCTEELPAYPASGYIKELSDCIVVNFG